MQVDAGSDGIVSRADNRNLKRLEQYDTEIDAARQAVIAAEDRRKGESSRIICAAVFMVEIMLSDADAWDAFKRRHKVETASKGQDWEYREVARLVWRQLAGQPEKQSRERISQYGKAIKVAHGFHQQGTTQPAKLLRRVTDSGGVKGLIKTSRRIKPASLDPKPRRISLTEPDRPTLVLFRPSGEAQTIPDDVARPFLIQIGALQ